ncbi:hypothetical protein H7K21_19480 [Cytobacillus firmus]|nr:hypothetical protein [Cytobacillus firmus]
MAENKREPASKIIGDTLGNIFVGAGVNALGAAATIGIMSIPALVSAPITTVVAVGFGVSVGLTYITEGIKWNVDLDNDDEDDSIKDMVKAGFTNGLETVAGWFK